jgi:hypothetical protein
MAENVITRKCTVCKIFKSLSEFHKDKSRKYGYRHVCKSCTIIHHQAHKSKERQDCYNNTEAAKISRKKYRQSEKGRKTIIAETSTKKIIHPEQYAARWAVTSAVRSHRLPNVFTLFCRGSLDCYKKSEVYHHHLGYAPEHWLDVMPVCKKCHAKLHQSILSINPPGQYRNSS